MPTPVACPKCQAKYNLPDNLLGKPVQCKSCGSRFKTAAKSAAKPPATKQPFVSAQKRSPQMTAEMAKLGLDGPIRPEPELFSSDPISPADPLANHVIEDPGFANIDMPVVDTGDEESEDSEFAGMMKNPEIAQPKEKKKSAADPLADYLKKESWEVNQQKIKRNPDHDRWIQIALFLPVLFVGFGLSFVSLPFGNIVFMICFGIMGLAGLGLQIWGAKLVHKNTDSVALAILAFLTPYMLYCIIVYWNRPYAMKWYVFALISLNVVNLVGVGLFILTNALNALA